MLYIHWLAYVYIAYIHMQANVYIAKANVYICYIYICNGLFKKNSNAVCFFFLKQVRSISAIS